MKRRGSAGYSVIELSVVLAVMVIFLAISSLGLVDTVTRNQALEVGVELRMIWRAEKLYLIDQLNLPQSLVLPTELAQLSPFMEISKITSGSTLDLGFLPPLDTRDRNSGTLVKSVLDPSSGDSLYDVGPE